MDIDSLEKLFGRVVRLNRKLGIKEGNGVNWAVKLENGKVHTYSIIGVKPPEDIEDDIE